MSAAGPDRLDQEHIDAAARFAAEQLAETGVARVRLAPGDMTEYPILIAVPGVVWGYRPHVGTGGGFGEFGPVDGRYYWVTLCSGFGAGYEWPGGPVDGGYATEKWTNHGSSKATRAWTGEVVARFLTAVSEAMAGGES